MIPRLSRSLAAIALAAGIAHAADDVALTVSMPSLADTLTRWEASYYGRAHASAPTDQLDGMARMGLGQGLGMLGLQDLPELASQLQGIEFGLVAGDRHPRPVVQIRGAGIHPAIIGLIGEGAMGQRVEGDALLLAPEGGAPIALSAGTADHDLVLAWSASGLARLQQMTDDQQDLGQLIPDGSVALTLTPEGIHTRVEIQTNAHAMAAVTAQDLAWIPHDALMVLSVGFDVDAWWHADADALFGLLAATDDAAPGSRAEALAMADQHLAPLGLPLDAAGLLKAASGGFTAALSNGAGYIPTLHLALRRNRELDQLIEHGLMVGGHGSIVDGQVALLTVTTPSFEMPILATGIGILRTADQWIISTDAVMLADYAEGRHTAWVERDDVAPLLAEIDGGTVGIGWGDTRNMLRILAPFAAWGGSMPMNGMLARDIQALTHRLAVEAGPDRMVIRKADGLLTIDDTGPLGGLGAGGGTGIGSLAVVAGLALPSLTENRQRAERTESMNNLRQIAIGWVIYETDFGVGAPDLRAIQEAAGLPPEVLISPLDDDGKESYLYVPSDTSLASVDPIVIEDPANHDWNGTAVAFADGHIEFVEGERALAMWEFAQNLASTVAEEGRLATQEDWKPFREQRDGR